MTTRTRRLALLLPGAALLGGLALAFGAPRITLLNATLRIDHPWTAGVGALAGAAGCVLWALALPPRALRVALGAAGAAATAMGAGLLTYRLEVNDFGLASRSWLGGTVIPWAQVSRVESGPARVVVWGVGDEQVRIDTSGFEGVQRAALDRAIARQVREGRRSVSGDAGGRVRGTGARRPRRGGGGPAAAHAGPPGGCRPPCRA